jgi:hypothetical protein
MSDDGDLEAVAILLKVLGPLKPDARANVLDFVFRKLGIQKSAHIAEVRPSESLGLNTTLETMPAVKTARVHADIRSLKEEKEPKTAAQMVALVAYYIEHLAPTDQHRDYVTTDDVTKYFKQAGFPLPKAPEMALTNARNSGYFVALGNGRYRLNPVGYNLVAHKLPASKEKGKTASRKRRLKTRRSSKASEATE